METCVRYAINKGLRAIAFTDHIWRTSDWVDAYVEECNKVKERYPGLQILIGAEAKAINLNGDVDISHRDAEKLDFVTGSVHRRLPDEPDTRFHDLRQLSPEEAARAESDIIVAMTENPVVNVIGHPMRLYYKFFYLAEKTRETFPAALLRTILSAVKNSGKMIELNYNVPDLKAVMECYKESGVAFLLGSDAHQADAVGDIPFTEIVRLCQQTQ